MQTLVERLYENKPLMFAAATIAFLIAALLLLLIVRMLFGGRLKMPGGRSRQARLGIVDAFDLDRQRQLIIVRRDNTEHLIMIGGPNDVLIESEIIRAEARDQRDARRDKVEAVAPVLPIAFSEPRIPASVAPQDRPDPVRRQDDPVVLPPAGFDDLPPAPMPMRDAGEVRAPDTVAPPRAPTFPLPPRRPAPVLERRPTPPLRPADRVATRTEPTPPTLDVPVAPPSDPAGPSAPNPAVAPLREVASSPALVPAPPLSASPLSTPPAPAQPAPRPTPPPFLRPLPPRTPKVLPRATPTSTETSPNGDKGGVNPPPLPMPPKPAAASPTDTLESLEEEMAKLLGRGTSER